MMGDGKALQMGTSHELGTNFAKAFNTQYLSKDGKQELVWQTSWGVSTRMVGGLIMSHGDDNGLRVPPRLAHVQVVVMAIKGDEAVAKVRELGDRLKALGIRVQVDDRVDTPFGRRAVDWELKGVPVRVEIGPRDLEAGTAMLARRIPGGKEPVSIDALGELLPKVLEEDQAQLLRESRERRESRTSEVTTLEEAAEAATAAWAGRASRGRPWAPRARPSSPSRPCPYGVWSPRTGPSPRPTTPPVPSPSSPAPTERLAACSGRPKTPLAHRLIPGTPARGHHLRAGAYAPLRTTLV